MKIKDDDKPFWLALWRVPRIGPVTFNKLLHHVGGDLRCLFSQAAIELKSLGLSPAQIDSVKQFRSVNGSVLSKLVDQDLRWLDSSDEHHLLLSVDGVYPPLLKEIDSTPPLLFVKGDVDTLAFPQIAIVGSRNPTRMGKDTAYEFARYFSGQGFITTSGLATGIDGAAHKGAVEAEGYTIAVLAHGLDQIYPKANKALADRVASCGALVSEYPVGVGPRPEYFPRRNRIVSGMSLGVLVVEAAKKSGSLITAREAVQQGREVFAIPGSIHNPLSKGCHELIRQGAKLVENGEHVVEELLPLLRTYRLDAAPLSAVPALDAMKTANNITYPSNSTESQILGVLEYEACSVDLVVSKTGISVAEVNSALVMLELDGVITSSNRGYLLA